MAVKEAFTKGSRLNASVITASDTASCEFPASFHLCVAGSVTLAQTVKSKSGSMKNKASGSPNAVG